MSETHTGGHITPLRTYLGVGAALLFLTVVTVAISFVHLGPFNLVVAMLVASLKGTLVVLFFMHLLHENRLYMLVFVASLVFLSILIIFVLFDTMTRGDMEPFSQLLQGFKNLV